MEFLPQSAFKRQKAAGGSAPDGFLFMVRRGQISGAQRALCLRLAQFFEVKAAQSAHFLEGGQRDEPLDEAIQKDLFDFTHNDATLSHGFYVSERRPPFCSCVFLFPVI